MQIQEIRNSEKCKRAMTYLNYKFDENQFAILYGKKFMLNCLLLKGELFFKIKTKIITFNHEADNKSICDEWLNELPNVINYFKNATYKLHLHTFLSKEYKYIQYLVNDK
jgi:hypothetical protein